MNNEKRIIEYLKTHNGITSMEAIKELGNTRLSATIFNLKEQGYNVSSVWEQGKTRYGEIANYKRYFVDNIMEMENASHIPSI